MTTQETLGVVMEEVRECGPCSVADISTAIGRSPTTVRRALKALEEAGEVESDNYQRRARVFMEVER